MPLPSILPRAVLAVGLFSSTIVLGVGCSKKDPPPAPPEPPAPAELTPEEIIARDRAHWLANLRSTNPKTRQQAVEQLSIWVETDPSTVAALLELLGDKSNAGAGKTHPTQINSIREAAVRALLDAGPKGEVALQEKGLAALKEGLHDSDPAVREHTAHTVGLLGPIARPLSDDLLKLCTDPQEAVRGVAFDALRLVGITDVAAFARLLTHDNEHVTRLTSEIVPTLPDVPEAAVTPLTAALAGEDEAIRTAAANALATAGPKAAPAVSPLVAAIKQTRAYRGKYTPKTEYSPGPEMAYWRALVAIGEPAVSALAGLLTHENALVRGFTARALGEIGAPARSAADKLRGALRDDFGFVAVEAACTLVRIDESKEEAVEVVKRAMEAPGNVAMIAIEAIGRMGEPGKPLVADALARLKPRGDGANPYAQYAAIGLVGTLSPEEATKYAADVGGLATHKEPLIRQRAGFVLEKLGPAGAPAAEALANAIPREPNAGIRDQFIDALSAMGPGAKPALPTLLKLAADESSSIQQRQRLIAAIAQADPASKQVTSAILTATSDPSEEIRSAAISAMGKLDPVPPEALAKLVTMAKTDRATAVRVAAYRALAALGTRAAPVKADVEELAAGKYPEFVLLARVALASIGGNIAEVAPEVRAGLTHRLALVRSAAVGALLLIGPTEADLPALLRLVKDRNPSTRELAVKCIGKLGTSAKEAIPQLMKLLDDTEPLVQLAAIEVLGTLGPAALPAVEKLKQLRGTDMLADPLLSSAASKALEKLGVGERR